LIYPSEFPNLVDPGVVLPAQSQMSLLESIKVAILFFGIWVGFLKQPALQLPGKAPPKKISSKKILKKKSLLKNHK
jgi:hypothetical protein